jgi:hypothetical protein
MFFGKKRFSFLISLFCLLSFLFLYSELIYSQCSTTKWFGVGPGGSKSLTPGPMVRPGTYWVKVGRMTGGTATDWKTYGPYSLTGGSAYLFAIKDEGGIGVVSAPSKDDFILGFYSKPTGDMSTAYYINDSMGSWFAICLDSSGQGSPGYSEEQAHSNASTDNSQCTTTKWFGVKPGAENDTTPGPLAKPGLYKVRVANMQGGDAYGWASFGPFDFSAGGKYLIAIDDTSGKPSVSNPIRDHFILSKYSYPSNDVFSAYYKNQSILNRWYAVCIEAFSTAAPVLSGGDLTIYDNGNIGGVYNGASGEVVFTLNEPLHITYIRTYHWNDGRGATPGYIRLQKKEDGSTFGPWPASGEPGSGGVPNANWVVRPGVRIPAGSYIVIDSDPSTWSQNEESYHQGMTLVKGRRD